MEISIANSTEKKLNSFDLEQNAIVLNQELTWLNTVIHTRIALHFGHETPYETIDELYPPDITSYSSPYANFVRKNHLTVQERLVLVLALVPHIKPEVLDILCSKNQDYDRRFSEFGGLFVQGHNGLIPTAETAMFILAGDDLIKRLHYQYIFDVDHVLITSQVIKNTREKKDVPRLSQMLIVSNEYVDYLTTGKSYQAAYSADFPAQRMTTKLEWKDLIVSQATATSLQEIRDWMTYGNVVMRDLDLEKQLKPGYKSLFYGPPGTGKTMTAALLGKSANKPVYRVDLSMVVSKYIGETEKNLAKVFDQAEHHDWILFFDEADALFGQRTQVNSANDRYGNQEIGYLLQRIEDFSGVVILATNLKDNIDEAFTRRFQSIIEFKVPRVEERHRLWKQSFSAKLPLDAKIDVLAIAEKYEISGGLIMNVVRKCTLQAVANEESVISQHNLEISIKKELQKEGIILN
ncbi:ATP-binding protein [Aquimarina algicola]|uniref:ATP-binding protein n=1 Tax=Aquimarina algicola TaxID=2589995 RepID=A0A504JGU0_9FLAO|nr:ATP-binding protein [Aquimarina algicola]TPN86988.1 ATP-binding protein [Aquimarina algicola]